MTKLTILLCVVLCLVAVNGRHYTERGDDEAESDEQNERADYGKAREHSAGQMRHRRKRWQSSHGYYPPQPYYFEDRRDDLYRNQQPDLLPQILRLLDEIYAYVKRPPPPPPPQPIYVPYAVPYPIPQTCNCRCSSKVVNITSRFPEMEDTNQNWGYTDTEDGDVNDGDNSRPINFDTILSKYPVKLPPAVNHGTEQAGAERTTTGSRSDSSSRGLRKCDAVILSCCRPDDTQQQKRKCFNELGCGSSFANGDACSKESVQTALDLFASTYSAIK